jgi:NTE family protein
MPRLFCPRVARIHPRIHRSGLAFMAALLVGTAAAAQDPASGESAKRPRVGLVLAGGGARGGAHVGVLKVLEEMRIPIDCIAGTSMGALVGGGYASGMSAGEIEQFLRNVDWKAVVGGAGHRPLQTAEQKRFNASAGAVELGIKRGKIVTRSGLLSTSGIEDLLRSYVARGRFVSDFDKLPIPFRAVATDMLTGNMVVLDRGDLAVAMRASMAVPGAFAPVLTDKYVLSDGFVVRNLPIDVARNTCADVVIAVNLVKAPVTREQLSGIASLVARSNDVMSEANERLQLQTLTDRDVRIDVMLGDIGAADFERTAEIIPLGEKAARAAAGRLAALSVSEADYIAWRKKVTVHQDIEIRVADVQFEGLKRVNPEYLRTLTRVHAGDTVDTAAISRDAARMAVVGDLDGVNYKLIGDPDNPVLVWEPSETPIGPNFLWPTVGIYGAGGGDLQFDVALQHVRRWLNSYGGEWRNRLQFGSDSVIQTSFYQPLNVAQTFFVEPRLLAEQSIEDVFDGNNRVARYHFIDAGVQFDVGANLTNSAQIRAGYFATNRRTIVDIGAPLLPEVDTRDAGLAATATYDSREAESFSSQGLAAEIEYFKSDSALGAERDWQRIEAAIRKGVPLGKMMLWFTAAGGSDLGSELPADRAFSLGGPQSFPGYAIGEVRARSYWTVDGAALWHVADILSIFSQSLYGGLRLEGGRVYERVDPTPNGPIYGGSILLGGRTPIGTLTVGFGWANGSRAGWITLGTPVGRGSILNQPMFR